MNLLTDAWIPAVRKDGDTSIISPLSLLEGSKTNPFVRIATGRPDFDGAILQFLIGLYQVLLSPVDEDEWRDLLEHPPVKESLNEEIDLISPAFIFDEGDCRFMQDDSVQGTDEWELSKLILEINNTLFLKEGSIRHLCPNCAAMALLTLQLNSPSGGRGHMTSLRGGGPLTTLLCLPEERATLWNTILLNVFSQEDFPSKDELDVTKETLSRIFPWIDEVPNSENGAVVVPKDMHPYHVYWNVPRRIYVDCSERISGVCDICGSKSEKLISHYWSRPNGIKYDSWHHPMSPYYLKKDKSGDTWLSVHAHESDLTYANWIGIVMRSREGDRIPADVVMKVASLLRGDEEYSDLKIHVFGYVTDKAKIRAWQEGILPTIRVDEVIKGQFFDEVSTFVDASSQIAYILVSKVKAGFTSRPDELKKDLSGIKMSFWQESESVFYSTLHKLPDVLMQDDDANTLLIDLKKAWLSDIRSICLSIFKDWASYPTFGEVNPSIVARAELDLRGQLSPNNSRMTKLLGLPAPEKKSESKVK